MYQYNKLKFLLLKYRSELIGVAVFTAIINILMLAPSVYMLQLYDRVLSSHNGMTLLMLSLALVLVFVIIGVLDYVRAITLTRIAARLERRLIPVVYEGVFKEKLQSGQAVKLQALDDLSTMRQFISGPAPGAFCDLPWFPIYLLVLFIFHPWLGFFALFSALALMLLAWFTERVSKLPATQVKAVGASSIYQLQGQLQNAETIQAMAMLPNLYQRWLIFYSTFLAKHIELNELTAFTANLSKSVRMMCQSLILGIGAWLVIRGEIGAGTMIVGSILQGRVLAPIDQIIGVWRQWGSVRQSYDSLQQLLHTPIKHQQPVSLPSFTGGLKVEHLVGGPPMQKKVTLAGINFVLEPGEVLVVLGYSGSGKSTLARLLMGIWPCLQGRVLLDDAPRELWPSQQIATNIGYLSQDIEIFGGKISENIARFAPDMDLEKVVQAAQVAGVHELILTMADGYDSILGYQGQGLSGGQRQRIALARACYGFPKLVLLDEPNSNLDEAGEQALHTAIQQLKANGCTVIVISHKPNLLSLADKVLVLHEGKQVKFGASETKTTQPAYSGFKMNTNWK